MFLRYLTSETSYSAQPKGGGRILKWARFFFSYYFLGVDFPLMLIGWRAANMSSTSSGEEGPWRSKTVEQITLDLFQNCDVPEEVSGTFDPEVDLNDDAVGRSRYERFYSVRSNYARENLSLRRRSREPSRVGCLWRNFRVWSWDD